MQVLLILLFIIIASILGIVFVVKRAAEFTLLVKDGVDIQGMITSKRTYRRKNGVRNYYIKYEYRGFDGKMYNHESNVAQSAYDSHEEKGIIELVVSQSKPSVSAPKYLVEEARKAVRGSAKGV